MKTIPELVEVTKRVIAERESAKGQGVGTLRVDVHHREQKTLEAVLKSGDREFSFLIDEPRDRGGVGDGGNPLGYFLAGAGGCLMMQYVSLAIAQELPIDKLSMIVRAHIVRQVPCYIQDMVYDVLVEGKVSPEQVEKLAKDASHHCFVDNTLPKAIPIKTVLHLNGKEISTLDRGPEET